MASFSGTLTKPLPSGRAIPADFSGFDLRFEKYDCRPQPSDECAGVHGRKLSLGIVNVEQVDRFEIQVVARTLQLIIEVLRRHAMALHDVFTPHDAASKIILL